MRITTERAETIAVNDYSKIPAKMISDEFSDLAADLLEARKLLKDIQALQTPDWSRAHFFNIISPMINKYFSEGE